MKKNIIKHLFVSILLLLLATSGITFAQSSNFSYGFEAAPGANDWSANISVASGTNGITAASGGFYGLVPNMPPVSQFTRFGGYSSVFSCNGYKTSIKIYLDVSLGHANDTRATYTVASSNSSGAHRRDFVFSIGFYNDAVAPGTGNRFVVSASNTSPGWPKDPGRNPTVVATTSGWYTFEHSFENNAGVLQVVMKVYDASSTVVGTWTLSDPTDLIPSVVGGNRYGWFTVNQFSFLAVDDVSLSINSVTGPVHNINTGLNYCTIQAAIDAAPTSNGDVITVDAGTYTENINVNKSVTINGPNAGIAGSGGRGAEAILLNCLIDINNAGTTTLDGLQIKRTDALAGDQILLDGAGTNTVQNCIIERWGSVTGTVIRGITTTAGGGAKNILNNKFTGDPISLFSGHKSWNNAIYINGGTAVVNMSGNTIMNCRTALSIDDYSINVVSSGNTFNNNGTHIGLGGTVPTAGQFVMGANDFINNPASTMVNCSNVNVNFRLDITSSTLGGVAFSALSNAQLFDVEARMAHKTTGSKKGKVIYVANTQYVNNITAPFVKIDQIQNSVLYAEAGNIINLQAGTYPQRVVIDKPVTLQGVESTKALYILDGTGLAPNGSGAGSQSGIVVNSGIINTTIKDLTVQNFAGVSGNSDGGIYGLLSNNNLTITNVALLNNTNASGFYANGPVDNVSVTNSMLTNNGGGARGMVIWNGLKTNITFSNNMLTNNSCCGIELQDGNASGVTVTGNTINIGGGDNAIGLVGLNASIGANTISGNIITGGGRFGIELKNPAGGVTVNANTVTLSSQNSDLRDRAGIAVFRRGVTAGNVDVPNGVTVTGNTVTDYQQASASEGFGIVVEGTNHTVTGNTVTGCDVGILQQQNPSGYPGDADQSNLADLYFGRGNSPMTCGNTINGNTLSNTINSRNIGVGGGIVTNTTTLETFCSIQAAINDVQTLTGHTIIVSAGTYNENININKTINLRGAQADNCAPGRTGAESVISCPNGIGVNASDVTINGFTIRDQNGANAALAPGFGYAVFMAPPNTGTQLLNNIFTNNTMGTGLSNTGATPAQVNISCNWYDANVTPGPSFSGAIIAQEPVVGKVSNVLIDKNKFSNHSNGVGISFENPSNPANAATGITMTSNTFDANLRALTLYNLQSSSFSNNEVSNSTFATSGDVRIFGGVHNLAVTNNKFDGSNGVVSAFRITAGSGPNSNITVFENSFTGYTTPNPVYATTYVAPGGASPATCNWYGTINNATIASIIGAPVAYAPYLINGTDNLPATGFQPVPGSCNGSNVLTITCPANMSVQCTSQIPAVNVGSVTTSGTCPGVVVTHMGDVISNQTCANRYTLTRTYQATDACGNTATCTQTITVNDNTPPTITCPPNQTVAPATLTGTVVTYPTPAVSDNCAGVGAAVRTAGPASGSAFPIGTTTVTFQVTDACGLTASCSFTVTVAQLPYCDNKQKKVYMCHNGNTICVSLNAVQAHLNHGDYLGQCTTSLRSVVVEEPVTDEFRVNVAPNPSAGAFRIQVISKSIEPISVRVMDLSGKVLTVNSNAIKNSIVLGNELKPGTYIAEVIQGTNRQVIKLVKLN